MVKIYQKEAKLSELSHTNGGRVQDKKGRTGYGFVAMVLTSPVCLCLQIANFGKTLKFI